MVPPMPVRIHAALRQAGARRCDNRGMEIVLATLKNCQYVDAIPEGGVRIEIRGVTQAGTKHGIVRLENKVDNDTLLITLTRDVALQFWKQFSKATREP